MAQQKRLTRRQKILLSKIQEGRQPSRTDQPADLQLLQDRGLITLEAGGWQAVVKEGGLPA